MDTTTTKWWWLPRPDQMAQRPELASLAGLIAQLEITRRALRAAYPHVWYLDAAASNIEIERRAWGIEMRAFNLLLEIEDYFGRLPDDPDPDDISR